MFLSGSSDRQVGIGIHATDEGASATIGHVGSAIGGLGTESGRAHSRFGALGSLVRTMSTGIFLGVGVAGFQALTGAIGGFGGAVIGMNATLETSTLQFKTLMGSSDAARKHVEELFDFAAKTPFESGPIIQASRIMRTFGGATLDSKKNLRLFGDAAAATSAPINEVAFWMSRAYADIQAGRPFGEAAMRLSELGIVTPQVRNKLEDMQKTGAKSSAIWNTLTGSLGRFSGAMGDQAETWEGLKSTAVDNVRMMLAQAFKPLFEGGKGLLKGFNAWLGSAGAQDVIKRFAAGLQRSFSLAAGAVRWAWGIIQPILAGLADLAGQAWSVVGPIVGEVADVFGSLVASLGSLAGGADLSAVGASLAASLGRLPEIMLDIRGKVFDVLGDLFAKAVPAVADGIRTLARSLPRLLNQVIPVIAKWVQQSVAQTLKFASGIVDTLSREGPGLITAIRDFLQTGFNWLMNTGVPMLAGIAGQLAGQLIDWVAQAAPKILPLLGQLLASIIDFLVTNLPVFVGKLYEWAAALIGWIIPQIPSLLSKLAEMLGQAVEWIVTVGVPYLVGAVLKLARGFLANVLPKAAALVGKIGEAIGAIIGWLFPTGLGKIVDAGLNLARGLISGMFDLLMGRNGQRGLVLLAGDALLGKDGLIPKLLGFIPKMAKAGLDLATSFARSFANGLVDLIQGAINAVIDAINSFQIHFGGIDLGPLGTLGRIDWNGLGLSHVHLPHFELGAWDLPADMLAMVHRHEMIVPAAEAERLRRRPDLLGGAGPTLYLTIVQHFGPSSVRSREDIRDIGRETAERGRLLGAALVRA